MDAGDPTLKHSGRPEIAEADFGTVNDELVLRGSEFALRTAELAGPHLRQCHHETLRLLPVTKIEFGRDHGGTLDQREEILSSCALVRGG